MNQYAEVGKKQTNKQDDNLMRRQHVVKSHLPFHEEYEGQKQKIPGKSQTVHRLAVLFLPVYKPLIRHRVDFCLCSCFEKWFVVVAIVSEFFVF